MPDGLKDLYTKLQQVPSAELPDFQTFTQKYGNEAGFADLYNKMKTLPDVEVPDYNTFKSKYFTTTSPSPSPAIAPTQTAVAPGSDNQDYHWSTPTSTGIPIPSAKETLERVARDQRIRESEAQYDKLIATPAKEATTQEIQKPVTPDDGLNALAKAQSLNPANKGVPAMELYKNPQNYTRNQFVLTGTEAASAIQTKMNTLQDEIKNLQTQQSSEQTRRDEAAHPDPFTYTFRDNSPIKVKTSDGRVVEPKNEITALQSQLSQLALTNKQLTQGASDLYRKNRAFNMMDVNGKSVPVNLEDPAVVQHIQSMSPDDFTKWAITEQAAIMHPTSMADFTNTVVRATKINPDKAAYVANLKQTFPKEVLASPKTLAIDRIDTNPYEMSTLQRQTLGYNGTATFLEKLNDASKQTIQQVKSLDPQIDQAKVAYTQNPTDEGYKKITDLIQAQKDLIEKNLNPKLQLADKVSGVLNDKFDAYQVHEALQREADNVEKNLLNIISYTTESGIVNNFVLGPIKGIKALTGSFSGAYYTPGDGVTMIHNPNLSSELAEFSADYNAATPSWMNGPAVTWDDKGFRLDPLLALHSALDMGIKMGGYIAGGAPAAGLKGALGFGGRALGMALASEAMSGGDQVEVELNKGLSAKQALTATTIRNGLNGVLFEALFSPVHLIKNADITPEMLAMSKDEALSITKSSYEQAASAYQKLFGKTLSPEAYKYLMNTKEAIKSFGTEQAAQVSVGLANDLADHMVDKYIQQNVNPLYEVKELSAKDEFLNALNTIISVAPISAYGALNEYRGTRGTRDNSIGTARYLVGLQADMHFDHLSDQLSKGLITPEEAAKQAKMIGSLEDIHNMLQGGAEKGAYATIESSHMSDVEKQKAKIQVFNLTHEVQEIGAKILELQDKPEEVEKLNKYLLERQEKINEVVNEATKSANASPEEVEKDRVAKDTAYLHNEYSLIGIYGRTNLDEVQREKDNLLSKAETETNPSLKNLYEEKATELEARMAVLRNQEANTVTDLANKIRAGYDPAANPLDNALYQKHKEAVDNLLTQPTITTVTGLDRPELTKYAVEQLKLNELDVNGMTDEHLEKLVKDDMDLKDGTTEKQVDEKIRAIKAFGSDDEKQDELFKLWQSLAQDGKNDLATKVNQEYETLKEEAKGRADAGNAIEFQGRTFTKGNYVADQDGIYHKIIRLDTTDPKNPYLVIGPKNGAFTLHISDIRKLGDEVEPKDLPQTIADDNNAPTQEDLAKLEVKEPQNIDTPVVSTPDSIESAQDQQEARTKPVNPLRTIREEDPTEPTFKTWVRALDHVTESTPDGNYLKAGFAVSIMSPSEIPLEHMKSTYEDYVSAKLGGDRTKDTGKLAVITDEKGEPILFGDNGKPSKDGHWAISEIPVVYDSGIAKKLKPTDEELKASGKTKDWFNKQLDKLRDIRNSVEKRQPYTIETISEGNSAQDYSKDKPVTRVLKSSDFTLHVALKDQINGYPTKKGYVYAVIGGTKEPIRMEKPRLTDEQINTIIQLSKQTIKPELLEALPAELRSARSRMEYLRKLVYSGLNATIDFRWGSGHGVYDARDVAHKAPLSDDQLREFLQGEGLNPDLPTLKADNAFTEVKWDGEKFTTTAYPKYSEFLKDKFNTYTDPTPVAQKTGKYIEFGDPIESLPGKMEEENLNPPQSLPDPAVITPEEPIKEIPPVETLTQEPKAGRKFKKLDLNDVPKTELGDFLKEGLDRSKKLVADTTPEQDARAEDWFKNHPISNHIKLEQFQDIINSDAYASWRRGAITLWNGAHSADLYHEAWHEFSQLYMSKVQKTALYDEIAKTEAGKKAIVQSTAPYERAKALEELIAEDFRKYVLSDGKLILDGRAKRNSIFRRIYEALRFFFTGHTDLQGYYDRLYKGNFEKLNYNENNMFFGNLTKGIEGKVDGQQVALNNRQTRSLYRAMDSLIGQAFANAGKPITMLFDKSNVLNLMYRDLRNTFARHFNDVIDKMDTIEDQLHSALGHEERQELEAELQALTSDAKNLQFVNENWEEVVRKHQRYSPFMTLSADRIDFSKETKPKFDKNGARIPTEDDDTEQSDIENSRDSSVVKNEYGISSKAAAENEIVYLIATLPGLEYTGETVNGQKTTRIKYNDFLSSVPETADFSNTWNTLSQELSSIFDYGQMIAKIQKLGETRAELSELAKRLPDPEKPILTNAELRLRNAFLGRMSMAFVPAKEIVMRLDSRGGIEFDYKRASATSENKLLEQFKDNFQNFTAASNPYVVEDPATNTSYLDSGRLLQDFAGAANARGKDAVEAARPAKVQFLEHLGFEFSPETLLDKDFTGLLDSPRGAWSLIYSGMGPDEIDRKTAEAKPTYLRLALQLAGEQMVSPLAQLAKKDGWIINGKRIANTQYGPINDFVKVELKHSNKFFIENATNANGDTVWQKAEKSFHTNLYAHLNNAEKYPTYQDLVADPALIMMDIKKDAFRNGLYLNSLFVLDKDPGDITYGTRRMTWDRGKEVPVQVALDDYNGLLKEGIGDLGKTSTDLTAFEKFIQNFNSLLVNGISPHPRYGDKSKELATSINGVYDPSTGKIESGKDRETGLSNLLFIPTELFRHEEGASISSFRSVEYMPDRLFSTLKMYLQGDIIPMRENALTGKGNNWLHYKDNIKDFGIMDEFVSDATKKKMREMGILGSEDGKILPKENLDVAIELKKLDKDLRKDFTEFIKRQALEARKRFSDVADNLEAKDLIHKTLLAKYSLPIDLKKGDIPEDRLRQLCASYAANQIVAYAEHLKLVVGDPRFTKAGKTKKDIFKRFSQFSATGNNMIVDDQTNATIQQNHPRLFRQALIDKLKVNIPLKNEDGHILSTIFKDVEYSSDALIDVYKKALIDRGMSDAQAEAEIAKYKEINEADGQGHCTLDEYKQSKLRSGSSHWTSAHEAAYQKEAAFLAGKSTEGMSTEETALFPSQKWQYAGLIMDNSSPTGKSLAVPGFYKFSVSPLLPSMIKGTSFEGIHESMIKQNIGLSLFNSASKHSAVLDADGQFNSFYTDQAKREANTGDYTTNKIFYNYLKEQVNVDPTQKEKVTFSTQMRKLMHLNLFTHGVPDDFNGSMANWDKLSADEKMKASAYYRSEQNFGKLVDKMLDLERSNVLRKMGATLNDKGGYDIDDKKFTKYLQDEFIKRGLPDEAVDFLQTDKGKLKWPLDASTQKSKIEDVALSIANRKLVQQKINGDALIQVASTGYELNESKLKGATPEDLKKWGDGNDLPFYLPEGRTLADGSKVTSAMKIKVALTDRWKPLLNLTHTDGQSIGSIERLNEMIKDEDWLNKEQNRKAVSLVGVRIPVQGLNSHEFMEVYHFLPAEAGNIVIVAPQIVAKSGGDFDIDKLTTYMPNLHIDSKGRVSLYDARSPEEVKALYNKIVDRVKTMSDPEKLKYNQEQFDQDTPPTESEFTEWYTKKSLENQMIDNVRENLERTSNFRQLIRPNDTDLLEPYAKKLKAIIQGSKKPSWSDIITPEENLRQFQSNLAGKSNLGIAAVGNTMFALLQRAGMYLAPGYERKVDGRVVDTYRILKAGGREAFRELHFNLTHNEVEVDGKKHVSLSGQNDALNEHLISDVISQFINGFVDVAKDDWVFFINGVREMVPTMLYTTMAGVNNKTMLSFFNHPIMREYVKELENARSLFTQLKSPDAYNFAKRRALEKIFLNSEVDDPTAKAAIDKVLKLDKDKEALIQEFKTREDEFERDIKKALNNGEDYVTSKKGIDDYAEIEALREQLSNNFDRGTAVNKMLETFERLAAADKDLFQGADGRAQRLYDATFNGEKLSRFDELKLLAHFRELQEQSGLLTSLQTTLNADTRKAASTYSIYDRQEKGREAKETKLFPEHVIDRMKNESTVRGFLNSENGFDKFVSTLYSSLFETNHPLFNTFLRNIYNSPNYGVPFSKRNANADDFQKTFKNDFIQYLFQNYVYKDGGYTLTSETTRPLFRGKDSMGAKLIELRGKYPKLGLEFPFLNLLAIDKAKDPTGKVDFRNLKFRKSVTDPDELNSVTQQIKAMQTFSDPDYNPEQQQEIQDFAKKFSSFAFMQSGFNKGLFYMTDVIPNEDHSPYITPAIRKFRELMDRHPDQAKAELQTFARLFKSNNRTFFDEAAEARKEGGGVVFNKFPWRGKNYYNPNAYDLLGIRGEAKQVAEQKEVEALPAKVQLTESSTTHTGFIKSQPNAVVVMEDNKLGNGKAALEKRGLKNFADFVTRETPTKPLIDENIKTNVASIEANLRSLIEKSKTYSQIIFPKDGVGMHLKDSAPKTWEYLSGRLHDLFNYTNPGYDPNPPAVVDSTDPYALAVEQAKKTIFETSLREYAGEYGTYLNLPPDFTAEQLKDNDKYNDDVLLQEYGKNINGPEDWEKAKALNERFPDKILFNDGGEPVTFDDVAAYHDQISFTGEEDDHYYDNLEQLITDWRADRIPTEIQDQVETFLKDHGLLKYKIYDPNQLRLFTEKDFTQEGCDKPCE